MDDNKVYGNWPNNQQTPNTSPVMSNLQTPTPNSSFAPEQQPAPMQPIPVNQMPQNFNNKPNRKNKVVIVGAIIAASVVAAVAVILLLGGNGGTAVKKTLTCTRHIRALGLVADSSYVVKIGDGVVPEITSTTSYDLEKTKFDATESEVDEWAQEKINEDKLACNDITGCKFSHTYKKGVELTETLVFDANGSTEIFGSDVAKYSADEIYEKVKTKLEGDEQGYTCQ